MTTEELCEELMQRYQGWNLDGTHGVLRYLNQAHKTLLHQECSQRLVLDEATGTLPILTTTSAVFAYSMPVAVWRVANVLVATDDPTLNDYGSVPASRRNEIIVGGQRFLPWPYVRQKTDFVNTDNPARIVFSEDPGNTTDRFYLQQYKNPVDILSIPIQGEIGSPHDFGILLPLAGAYIEAVKENKYIEADNFAVAMRLRMAKVLNSGIQGSSDEPSGRREF